MGIQTTYRQTTIRQAAKTLHGMGEGAYGVPDRAHRDNTAGARTGDGVVAAALAVATPAGAPGEGEVPGVARI